MGRSAHEATGLVMSLSDRCANCGKTKGDHHAETLLCPRGKKTRIGYIHYGPTRFVKEGAG